MLIITKILIFAKPELSQKCLVYNLKAGPAFFHFPSRSLKCGILLTEGKRLKIFPQIVKKLQTCKY